MKTDPLKQASMRALRYWYTDGISEIVFGGLCVLLGVYFWAQSVIPEDTTLGSMLSAGLVVLVIGGVFLGRTLTTILKERLTYARTGYIAYPNPSTKRRLFTGLVALFLAMLISAMFASSPSALQWIPAASGLVFAAAWLYFGHRVGLARFYLLAVFSALAGFLLSRAGWNLDLTLAAFYSALGFAILISGAITLAQYLRRTQPSQLGGDAEGMS
jgi:hypothetical protein